MLMLTAALLIGFGAPDSVAFDDANLALTACSFEAYRAASSANLSVGQFEQALQSRCSAERARLRSLFIDGRIQRQGATRPAAAREADALLSSQRASFISQYARRAETEAQLRKLERALDAQAD